MAKRSFHKIVNIIECDTQAEVDAHIAQVGDVPILKGTSLKDKLLNQSGATIISGGLQLGDSITINIPASVNDLVVPDIDKVSIIDFNVTAISNLTGITNPLPLANRLIFMYNIGIASLTIKANSALSSPDYRFNIATDILLQVGEGAVLTYDKATTIKKWKVPAKNV